VNSARRFTYPPQVLKRQEISFLPPYLKRDFRPPLRGQHCRNAVARRCRTGATIRQPSRLSNRYNPHFIGNVISAALIQAAVNCSGATLVATPAGTRTSTR